MHRKHTKIFTVAGVAVLVLMLLLFVIPLQTHTGALNECNEQKNCIDSAVCVGSQVSGQPTMPPPNRFESFHLLLGQKSAFEHRSNELSTDPSQCYETVLKTKLFL